MTGRLLIPIAVAACALGVPASAAAVNTYTVNTTADAVDQTPGDNVCATAGSVCTLRAAIMEANATPNVSFDDQIKFAIGAAGSAQTIQVAALPAVTDAVVIDGLSQGGSGYAGVPLITVNGPGTATPDGGFRFLAAGANNSVIDGLVLEDFDIAIQSAAGSLRVEDNYIGITTGDLTGSPHANGIGIRTSGTADSIGNVSQPGKGNVISGNAGTAIDDTGTSTTSMFGNHIGTTADGTAARPNGGSGIHTVGGANIGSDTMPNVISGNGANGILVDSGAAADTFVDGNLIGTNGAGTAALGNNGSGIRLDGGSVFHIRANVISGNADGGLRVLTSGHVAEQIKANKIGVGLDGTTPIPNTGSGGVDIQTPDNFLGGTLAGEGNTIADNTPFGVRVLGAGATGNRIRSNLIFDNTGLGIDLGGDGVTTNDPAPDPDAGANQLQNFPVIGSAVVSGGATTIQGTLPSTANRSFNIDFFSSPACDPSGFGEGQSYLGSTSVTTDGSGNASFSTALSALAPGTAVSATATDATTRDTSELAHCASVTAASSPQPTCEQTSTCPPSPSCMLTNTCPPPPDRTAPVLGATRATPPTFAVNPKGPPENAVASRRRQPHRGTTFRYAISESARVVFTIELTAKGRRVGNRCVKPTPANRRKRACTRYTLVGRFARSAVTGANTKSFSGRIGRKRLSPGSYRATLVATDAAGNRSKPRYVLFRVVRG